MKPIHLAFVAVFAVACGGGGADATPPATPTSGDLPPGFTESKEGGECGDDVAIKKKCAAGLVCAPSTSGPVSEHTPGTCKKK
jgi:hypothetical protein